MSLIDEWTGEPRTAADIMRSLLDIAEEHEWVEVTHYCGRGCGCVRGHGVECPTCHGEQPNHKPGCRRDEGLRAARAFISAEEQLEQEQGR